jgi:hypothetical protein
VKEEAVAHWKAVVPKTNKKLLSNNLEFYLFFVYKLACWTHVHVLVALIPNAVTRPRFETVDP